MTSELNTLQIRRASPADSDAVTRCVTAAYSIYLPRLGKPPAPMLESYAATIRTRSVFVAEDEGEVVGILVLRSDDDGLLLENVAVSPRHQGKGIGKALLQFAESEAQRKGFAEIHLYTNLLMTENQALYAKIGYVEYARRMEDGFSRVYMKKSLRGKGATSTL
jgi:ribosomal protein S18 acetylase RimI-like enzyme